MPEYLRLLRSLLLATATIVLAYSDEPSFAVRLGERQLLLDDAGVSRRENLDRALHQPRKIGAVIRPDPAFGETWVQIRSAPAWDEKNSVYQIWSAGGSSCYESRDGLHWVRHRTRLNHPVENVILDPDSSDPGRRYKGLVTHWGPGLEIVTSADGIHWHSLKVPYVKSEDESNLFYDRASRTFLATVKHQGPYGRTAWLTTSKDFEDRK